MKKSENYRLILSNTGNRALALYLIKKLKAFKIDFIEDEKGIKIHKKDVETYNRKNRDFKKLLNY